MNLLIHLGYYHQININENIQLMRQLYFRQESFCHHIFSIIPMQCPQFINNHYHQNSVIEFKMKIIPLNSPHNITYM